MSVTIIEKRLQVVLSGRNKLYELGVIKSRLTVPLNHVIEVLRYDEKRYFGRRGMVAPALSLWEVIVVATSSKYERVMWDVQDPAQAIVIELRDEWYNRFIVQVEEPDVTLQMIENARGDGRLPNLDSVQ